MSGLAAAVHYRESLLYSLIHATVETLDSANARPSRIPTKSSVLGPSSFVSPTTAKRTVTTASKGTERDGDGFLGLSQCVHQDAVVLGDVLDDASPDDVAVAERRFIDPGRAGVYQVVLDAQRPRRVRALDDAGRLLRT